MIPLEVVPGGGVTPLLIFNVADNENESKVAVTTVPVIVDAILELTVTLNVPDELLAGMFKLETDDVELPSVVIV
jgi:hypothetical protein